MADLPDSRMGYQQPFFANTGIDYFGPIFVGHERKTEKRYGVPFTCLTTQAVHLEIAHSLDTDSCLMPVRRIMARRGRPIFGRRAILTLSGPKSNSEKLSSV